VGTEFWTKRRAEATRNWTILDHLQFLELVSIVGEFQRLSKCIKTHQVVATSRLLHKAAFLVCNDA